MAQVVALLVLLNGAKALHDGCDHSRNGKINKEAAILCIIFAEPCP